MMAVGNVCTRTVVTARPEEMVVTGAARMAHYNVGTLVVVEGKRPVGIVTDRDVVLRVVATGTNPQTCALRTVMTSPPITVPETAALEDAVSHMCTCQVRRLVVVNAAHEVVGLLALDDMLELLGDEQRTIAALVHAAQGRWA
jgi:CBS domain-containing protein